MKKSIYNPIQYKIYTWKNGLVLHALINPGMAFNELVLGQRIPKLYLVEKVPDKPLYERTYIPCPHCNTLHDGRVWSRKLSMKNWFGLYCMACGKIIPCLTNVTNLLILALTYPIWGWFHMYFKEKWLAKQPERFRNVDLTFQDHPITNRTWVEIGLKFGFIMMIILGILFPLVLGELFSISMMTKALGIGVLMGLVMGVGMKITLTWKIRTKRGGSIRKWLTCFEK